jgi:hypothetical protein
MFDYYEGKMIWISFFPGKDYHRMPRDGQKVWFYGEPIGVWCGTYHFTPDDSFSHHHLHSNGGFCDRMDAPWWMPDEGQEKPQPPDKPYPDGYPA